MRAALRVRGALFGEKALGLCAAHYVAEHNASNCGAEALEVRVNLLLSLDRLARLGYVLDKFRLLDNPGRANAVAYQQALHSVFGAVFVAKDGGFDLAYAAFCLALGYESSYGNERSRVLFQEDDPRYVLSRYQDLGEACADEVRQLLGKAGRLADLHDAERVLKVLRGRDVQRLVSA